MGAQDSSILLGQHSPTSLPSACIVLFEVMAKAMKSMKAMKAKGVSFIAKGVCAKSSVFSGTKVKTASGLKKSNLTMNKRGKVVSKKQHAAGKKAYSNIRAWTVAVTTAKKNLNLKGFVAVKKGTPLYKAAKAIFKA